MQYLSGCLKKEQNIYHSFVTICIYAIRSNIYKYTTLPHPIGPDKRALLLDVGLDPCCCTVQHVDITSMPILFLVVVLVVWFLQINIMYN